MRKNLIKSAKNRGIAWSIELNVAWIKQQFEAQEGRCFYTGIPFEVTAAVRGMRRPSLDRRDNSRGYTADNVVLCLVAVNYLKNEWPENEFMRLLDDIRSHTPKK